MHAVDMGIFLSVDWSYGCHWYGPMGVIVMNRWMPLILSFKMKNKRYHTVPKSNRNIYVCHLHGLKNVVGMDLYVCGST
jgi:hypothetical protein